MKKTISLFIFLFILFSSPLLSQQKKVKVIDEKANIYVEPEKGSAVVEIVDRGTILTLLSTKKIREFWYYVSFRSQAQYITVSGFIHASAVEEISVAPEDTKGKKKKRRKTKKTVPKVKIQEVKETVLDPPLKIQVILESANVRSAPNFESEIIHQVESGLSLLAVGKIGEWFRVDLPPDEDGIIISGFIHKTLVREIRKELG
jgi:uncharacterized protein YgiM (DUF1202 family)